MWRPGGKRYDGRVLPFTSIRRPRFVRSLAAVALIAALGGTTGSADEIDDALEGIYRELEIQHELTAIVPSRPGGRGLKIPAAFGWAILGAAVVGTACAAVWLMAFDVDRASARRRRRRTRSKLDAGTNRTTPPAPGVWLGDADDLARQGRFPEAIHALLLGVLGQLPRPGASDAATAREIARAHAGPHAQRLNSLVQAAELVHFGGRPGTGEQYRRCRRDALELDGASAPA